MGQTLQLSNRTYPAGPNTRPARALIGWLPEREAHAILSLPAKPHGTRPEHLRRIERAHAAVASRPEGIDQTGILAEPGDELREHLAALRAHPIGRQYFDLGCRAAIVDLTRLCSPQWLVHSDYVERSGSLGPLLDTARQEDMRSLARLTLPLAEAIETPLTFDQQRNAWVLDDCPPNATVVANFSLQLEPVPGVRGTGYGFCIAQPPSFVRVVGYRGRYFLKDGHHRSVALLQRGISRIPALVETLPEGHPLDVRDSLPDSVLLGPRPPLLTDYLHPEVAVDVNQLDSRKNFVVQCREEQIWG